MTDIKPALKKPVPKWRTIVQGIWLDLLDDWAASFETSNRGTTGLGVFVQDQTTPVLTVPFIATRTAVTLASPPAVDQNVITLEPGHGVVVGEVIEMSLGTTNKFLQGEVVGVATDTITLDQPINQPYQVTDGVLASTKDLLVDGSVTPVVFSILPLATQSGDMVRIMLEIRGSSGGTMDFTTFGSETVLTNGCVLRINHGDGTYTNLFNFKSNSDFFEQGYDHTFSLPKQGNAIAGFTARVTWGGQSKHGVVIRLDGSIGEALELLIQDNLLAGNTRFHLTAQGHELQG